jgi:hypothetical protein
LLPVKKGTVRPGHGCRPNNAQLLHCTVHQLHQHRERQRVVDGMPCGSAGGRVAQKRPVPTRAAVHTRHALLHASDPVMDGRISSVSSPRVHGSGRAPGLTCGRPCSRGENPRQPRSSPGPLVRHVRMDWIPARTCKSSGCCGLKLYPLTVHNIIDGPLQRRY